MHTYVHTVRMYVAILTWDLYAMTWFGYLIISYMVIIATLQHICRQSFEYCIT